MFLPQTTQTVAMLSRTAVTYTQLALFTLYDPQPCGYLFNNHIPLALAGHNNYIPLAQEPSAMLPDGFSIGFSGWSQDYNTVDCG